MKSVDARGSPVVVLVIFGLPGGEAARRFWSFVLPRSMKSRLLRADQPLSSTFLNRLTASRTPSPTMT